MVILIWLFGDFYFIIKFNVLIISQAIYINVVLFTKLNVHQFAFTFQFGKLIIHQIYRAYGNY